MKKTKKEAAEQEATEDDDRPDAAKHITTIDQLEQAVGIYCRCGRRCARRPSLSCSTAGVGAAALGGRPCPTA